MGIIILPGSSGVPPRCSDLFVSVMNISVKVFYGPGGFLFLQLCKTAPGLMKEIMEPAAGVVHPSRRILTGYFLELFLFLSEIHSSPFSCSR